jgi:hypothetical protein
VSGKVRCDGPDVEQLHVVGRRSQLLVHRRGAEERSAIRRDDSAQVGWLGGRDRRRIGDECIELGELQDRVEPSLETNGGTGPTAHPFAARTFEVRREDLHVVFELQ